MNKVLQKIKQWKWANENPKRFYIYAMGILVLLLFINASIEFLTPKRENNNFLLFPALYKESDKSIAQRENKERIKEKKIKEIVQELQGLKAKRDKGALTTNDSLRIEFLYHQYQNIK